jgi:hypothetical protein
MRKRRSNARTRSRRRHARPADTEREGSDNNRLKPHEMPLVASIPPLLVKASTTASSVSWGQRALRAFLILQSYYTCTVTQQPAPLRPRQRPSKALSPTPTQEHPGGLA